MNFGLFHSHINIDYLWCSWVILVHEEKHVKKLHTFIGDLSLYHVTQIPGEYLLPVNCKKEMYGRNKYFLCRSLISSIFFVNLETYANVKIINLSTCPIVIATYWRSHVRLESSAVIVNVRRKLGNWLITAIERSRWWSRGVWERCYTVYLFRHHVIHR
jgi:hypothetical protein